jgi:hypothetical protein
MKTGNGKIANLPAHIRDELNYRLDDGEQGAELVEWLNAKPEVVKVLAERFDGRPISEQNLSQWRTHGYRQWHAYHVILDELDTTSEHSEEIAATGIDCEKLLLSLTAAYAEMIQRWIITPCDEMTYKLAVFKNITHAALALRRAEIQKARLELDARRLELLGEKQRNKSVSTSSSEAIGRGDGGGPGKSRAPSSPASSSTDSASAENASTPGVIRPNAPESPRSAIPAPPPHRQKPAPAPAPPQTPPVVASSPTAPGVQPSGNRPAVPISRPAAPLPPTPPLAVPVRLSTRAGGPPRNATPRNPLGLL